MTKYVCNLTNIMLHKLMMHVYYYLYSYYVIHNSVHETSGKNEAKLHMFTRLTSQTTPNL